MGCGSGKLAAFSANKLIPAVADEYLRNITENEMLAV